MQKIIRPLIQTLAVLGIFSVMTVGCERISPNDSSSSSFSSSSDVEGMNSGTDTQKSQEDTPEYSPQKEIKYYGNIVIPGYEGIKLAANVWMPKADPAKVRFPGIIFINSWVLEEHEYVLQARKFAQEGYVVLSYSSRGWGKSEGLVNIAGPNDMGDYKAVVDWMVQHLPVDINNIGCAGVSYGAGISLLGLAHDSIVKTAVVMSGWANLGDSIWGANTPRLAWTRFLQETQNVFGHPEPTTDEMIHNMLTHQNIDKIREWVMPRSAVNFLKEYNTRKPPVYFSHNLADDLFNPNGILQFYSQLTGPKRLDLNQGIHATAEAVGLLAIRNYAWNNAHDWFAYWLKGENNGIMERPPVSIQVWNEHLLDLGITGGEREEFSSWPSNRIGENLYYLTSLKQAGTDGILATKASSEVMNSTTISSGNASGITTGFPIIASILGAHIKADVKINVADINRSQAVLYTSEPLLKDTRLAGVSRVDITIEPSNTEIQLIAHLFDVYEGIASLITMGPVTLYDQTPAKQIRVEFELIAAARTIKAGHQLMLAFDTEDGLYAKPTDKLFQVTFVHPAKQPALLGVSVVK
ncbi:MAG: acyl esterase [SAR324 cluster bacterium]|nr:acyl esterase [SAR324 cluster bacterium]